MSKIIFAAMAILLTHLNANGQIVSNYTQCPDEKNSCGPHEKINERRQISDSLLQTAPFSFILHQEITRGSTNYSTGSFIGPNLIITAHHNVYKKFFIRNLSFCNKAVDPNKWIRFKKNEVEIILLGSVRAPSDIALIRIKNPEKIKELYEGHFELDSINSFADTDSIHLTGFPCDIPDILMEKTTTKKELRIHDMHSLIGYYIYTCTGDSGAPLWAMKNNVPTLVGIHHGGGESYFPPDWNASARINKAVIDWFKKHL